MQLDHMQVKILYFSLLQVAWCSRLKRHLMESSNDCQSSADCEWKNAVCKRYPECNTGKCACVNGTAEDEGRCKTTKQFGEECNPLTDLCLGYTVCTDGTCHCLKSDENNCSSGEADTHIYDSQSLTCKGKYDCAQMLGATCSGGFCACPPGSSLYVTTDLEYSIHTRTKYPRNVTYCVNSDVEINVQGGATCDNKHFCATGLFCYMCPYASTSAICVTPKLLDVVPANGDSVSAPSRSSNLVGPFKANLTQNIFTCSFLFLIVALLKY